ncbi:hypothetical protein LJB86_02710 [Deltaproteobacteria bacterium OttesenSCG-928-M10]|nr:hypothetical protein [Deltaproteobacteria bacterium OttesenSCG-928-M10]
MSEAFLDFAERDLAAIMASRAFDQAMEFRPEGGEPTAFRGLFSAPSEEQSPGGSSAPTVAQNFTVALKETDLPARPKRGDVIAARGHLWRVYKVMGDGQGLLTVSLQKAQL